MGEKIHFAEKIPKKGAVSISQLKNQMNTTVALGFFDGVHAGHRAVLETAFAEPGLRRAVFTFSIDSNNYVVQPEKFASQPVLLMSHYGKMNALASCGAEVIHAPAFSEIKDLSPEEFFETMILRALSAKCVSCGGDFRFGKDACAGIDRLLDLCRNYDIKLNIVPPVLFDGKIISSSVIRQLLADGNVTLAGKMGYSAEFTLPVIHGRMIARTLGMPTLNQKIPAGRVIPKFGVYKSITELPVYYGESGGKRTLPSISNIGVKPTVTDDNELLLETHIIGFDGDLYGQTVRVTLTEFLRGERKFSGISELKEQMRNDMLAAMPGKAQLF
ncbi:riboflavin biosynthesis protein [Clostridia bacterium]|nr:riboflavin biosynthesis protein [Clostridia bacterium]